jgi:hypothetical protein
MNKRALWWLAKVLEGAGLLVVLVGVFISISEGLEDQGLKSMATEFQGLALGGGLFLLGVMIERGIGSR